MAKSAKWLSRAMMTGPYVALCTTESQYAAVCKHLKVPESDRAEWVTSSHADAATHFYTSGGSTAAVVCVRPSDKADSVQTAALLVHEAVHIWQHYCVWIGEQSPSTEFEAYAIQHISQELMYAYADAMGISRR